MQYNRARYYDTFTGRWISQDPMGFDAGDSNLYRYVGNHAISKTDPTGKFEIDVHQFMTYYIARSIGLGDVKEPTTERDMAFLIAWSTQHVDDDERTKPIQMDGKIFLTLAAQRTFHFSVPAHDPWYHRLYRLMGGPFNPARLFKNLDPVEQDVKADSQYAAEALQAARNRKDPILFGMALHPYQDSWSHEGYRIGLGHARAGYGGHQPDYPWARPMANNMQMARRTFDQLAEFYCAVTGEAPKATWNTISTPLPKLFGRQGTPAFLAEYDAFALRNPVGAAVGFFDPLAKEWSLETNARAAFWANFLEERKMKMPLEGHVNAAMKAWFAKNISVMLRGFGKNELVQETEADQAACQS